MASHTVFLYGTLKRGEPNHRVLNEDHQGHARYLGRARTLHRWPLVVAGNLRIPYMLHCQDKGKVGACISNHMPSKVWDKITYSFPNFNDAIV